MADPVSDPVEKQPGSDTPEQTVGELARLLFRKDTSANANMSILAHCLLACVLIRYITEQCWLAG